MVDGHTAPGVGLHHAEFRPPSSYAQADQPASAVTDCQMLSVCELRQTDKRSTQKPFAQSGVSRHVVDVGDAERVANSWTMVGFF